MKKDTYFINKADQPDSADHFHLFIKWNYDGDNRYIIRKTSVSGDVTTYGYYHAEDDSTQMATDWGNRSSSITYTDHCPVEHADLVS